MEKIDQALAVIKPEMRYCIVAHLASRGFDVRTIKHVLWCGGIIEMTVNGQVVTIKADDLTAI